MQYITKMCFCKFSRNVFSLPSRRNCCKVLISNGNSSMLIQKPKKIGSNETVCRIPVLNLETDSDMIPSAAEQNQLFLC